MQCPTPSWDDARNHRKFFYSIPPKPPTTYHNHSASDSSVWANKLTSISPNPAAPIRHQSYSKNRTKAHAPTFNGERDEKQIPLLIHIGSTNLGWPTLYESIVNCQHTVPPQFPNKHHHFELNERVSGTNPWRVLRLLQTQNAIHRFNSKKPLFISSPNHLILQIRVSNQARVQNIQQPPHFLQFPVI